MRGRRSNGRSYSFTCSNDRAIFSPVSTVPITDGRRVRGDATRRAILAKAMQLASTDGLEDLSIARLAGELGMSKSGLFAHFGSKEELQLSTVRAARRVFSDGAVVPALDVEPGVARLHALLDAWFTYIDSDTFKGGCVLMEAAAEFDNRPGPVRDLVAGDDGHVDGPARRAVHRRPSSAANSRPTPTRSSSRGSCTRSASGSTGTGSSTSRRPPAAVRGRRSSRACALPRQRRAGARWHKLGGMADGAVLLVDDDAPIRRMLERTLGAEGYDVSAVADGGAALAAGRALAARRDRPRRRDAGARRAGGHPPAAREGPRRPDPAADRARRDRGARRRPRRGRRRLPREAVRRGRADRARASAAAPQPPAGRAARVRRPGARLRERHACVAAAGASTSPAARRSCSSCCSATPARVVTRELALEEVWGDGEAGANVVDRYVAYLRRKLGDPPLIHTVRGVGFRLDAP